uniref:Uncharacterized protein n=1 Tax=Spongospora subterranea TaxID=70186 RepID=A0A0H5QID7_9EUKA|eukprot:CRZ01080.1 hypothetical protein [Spongospora subterranea]
MYLAASPPLAPCLDVTSMFENWTRYRRVGDDLRLKNDEYERKIEGYVKAQSRSTEQMDAVHEELKVNAETIRKKSDEIEQLKRKMAKGAKDLEAIAEKKQVRHRSLSTGIY